MKGLMLAIGAPKDEESKGSSSPERTYAREAFSALKDDDEAGFVEAFLGAVRACKAKDEADEYEDEE